MDRAGQGFAAVRSLHDRAPTAGGAIGVVLDLSEGEIVGDVLGGLVHGQHDQKGTPRREASGA